MSLARLVVCGSVFSEIADTVTSRDDFLGLWCMALELSELVQVDRVRYIMKMRDVWGR